MNYDEERVNRLAHFLIKKVNRGIRDFNMIKDGDKVAVALSGGKDSFSLLRLLLYRQRFVRERYEVCAIHVVGDARGAELPPHPELPEWLTANGIEHLIRPTYLADDEEIPLPCPRCTWNRRRTLFEMADELGCNKLAFGHHMDDLAQTALLNLTFHGKNETMLPVREYFDGKLSIIRPLVYVPEHEIKRFSVANEFPPPPSLCPRGEHTQRRRMKDLITALEHEHPGATWNFARSALKAMGALS